MLRRGGDHRALPRPLALQLPVLIAGSADDEGLSDEKEGYFYPGCWSPY